MGYRLSCRYRHKKASKPKRSDERSGGCGLLCCGRVRFPCGAKDRCSRKLVLPFANFCSFVAKTCVAETARNLAARRSNQTAIGCIIKADKEGCLMHTDTDLCSLEHLPAFLTVEQLAVVLGVGRNTAYNFVRSNRIKNIRVGRQIRIPKSAVENL